jgi:hypothetical protein
MTQAEWQTWQEAWRAGASAPIDADAVAALRRRLARHRRLALVYTALDVAAALAFVAVAAWALARSPSLPARVYAVSLLVFTFVLFAFAVWNRRDALFVSAAPTADFVALLRLRQRRRERVPGFIVGFVVAEIAFGLLFCARVDPGALPGVAAAYAAFGVGLAVWRRRYRRRLARERAQIDALGEPEDRPPRGASPG